MIKLFLSLLSFSFMAQAANQLPSLTIKELGAAANVIYTTNSVISSSSLSFSVLGNRVSNVSNADTDTVVGLRTSVTGGNRVDTVTGNRVDTVTGNRNTLTSGNFSRVVTGSLASSVTSHYSDSVTGSRFFVTSGNYSNVVTGSLAELITGKKSSISTDTTTISSASPLTLTSANEIVTSSTLATSGNSDFRVNPAGSGRFVVNNLSIKDNTLASYSGNLYFNAPEGSRIYAYKGITVDRTSEGSIPSAIVAINSVSQGVLLPRLTTAQRDTITSPATGLSIYNTSTNAVNYYNGSAWTALTSSTTTPTVTAWVYQGSLTVISTGSSPVKSNSFAVDEVWSRRVGDTLHVRFYYRQTAVGTSGTGDYLFKVPGGVPIDGTKVNSYSTVEGGAGAWITNDIIGHCNVTDGNSSFGGSKATYWGDIAGISYIRIFYNGGANAGSVATGSVDGAGIGFASQANEAYSCNYEVPITGWTCCN